MNKITNRQAVNNNFEKLSKLRKIRHIAFLSDIENLARKSGVCYASNEYFQLRSKNVFTGSSIPTIQRAISVLKQSEFITVAKKNGNRREIRLTLRGHNILREFGFLNFGNENRQEINLNSSRSDLSNSQSDNHSDHSNDVIDDHADQCVDHSDHQTASSEVNDQTANDHSDVANDHSDVANDHSDAVNDHSDHSIYYSNYNHYTLLHNPKTENKNGLRLQEKENIKNENMLKNEKSEITVIASDERGPTAEQYAKAMNTLSPDSLSLLTDVLDFLVAI